MKASTLLLIGGGLILLGKARGKGGGGTGGRCPPRDYVNKARYPRDDELVTVPGGQKLRRDAAASLAQLVAAAERAGFKAPLFTVMSGHRNDAVQKSLWDKRFAALKAQHPDWDDAKTTSVLRGTTAPPGKSLHRSGCAADLNLGVPKTDTSYNPQIMAHPAWKWMNQNAHRFGWCPYTRDGEVVEAWHWEQVPCSLSGIGNYVLG